MATANGWHGTLKRWIVRWRSQDEAVAYALCKDGVSSGMTVSEPVRVTDTDLIRTCIGVLLAMPSLLDGVARDFSEQSDAAHRQLHDHVVRHLVSMNRRHRASQHVVKTQTLRSLGREDHLAREDADSDERPLGDGTIRGEQRAAIEGHLHEAAHGISSGDTRLEDAAQPNRTAKPWQVRATHQLGQAALRNATAVLQQQ